MRVYETGAPLVPMCCAAGVSILIREGTQDEDLVYEGFRDRYYTIDGWEIPGGAVVLDIGAAIGTFAVEAAEAGAAAVHSYEPIPESFGVLSRNAANYPAIRVVNAAVAVETGAATMAGYVEADGHIYTGQSAIWTGEQDGPGLTVAAVGIHDVLAAEAVWDIVKLDIEGHEYALIEAMTADEFAKIGSVVMEFHHDVEADTLSRGEYLAGIFEGHGFEVEVAWTYGLQGRLRARRPA